MADVFVEFQPGRPRPVVVTAVGPTGWIVHREECRSSDEARPMLALMRRALRLELERGDRYMAALEAYRGER